ncbi:MAG TPA: outer-membrane lipoprotein carrier protein LolA [Microvirga sp.]|nr:outer-membrane lipoprotein carrier protein LolA [Microvirga sp.]
MRLTSAALIVGLAATGAGLMPAAAQMSAADMLFTNEATILRPKRVPGVPPMIPIAPPAGGFNLTSAPLGPAFQPWRGPRTGASPSSQPRAVAEAPLPPRPARPAASPPAPAGTPPPAAPAPAPAGKPLVIAAVPPAAAMKAEPLSDQEAIDRANAFFTNLGTLVAAFTQIGGDGRRLTGTLYLQRPGKVRFEYDRPATIEVVADGSSVAVRDTKLATQDLYSISQTPLKFLLRERVNLGQDIRITEVGRDGDGIRIGLEDKSTLGGTSKITLFFDHKVEELTQWRIVDPQGFLTTLILSKVQKGRRLDQSLFAIEYTRAIGDNNNR